MIRFDQVTKVYPRGSKPALSGVTLEVLSGEFVFLVGASGSGKSSFLRLVLREERADRGRVHVLGRELGRLPNRRVPYFRRNLGVVFQDFRLLPGKTVFDNVAFSLQVIGKSRGFIQSAVPETLEMVGLAGKEGRLPHELSGGEQQRVAIARAVVNKPAILLADEPTGNLDPVTSGGIMTLLERINAGGTTVVMATHDVGIVDSMQRRVIELVGGQVVRDERHGGYVTQAIPVAELVADADPAETADMIAGSEAAVASIAASAAAVRPVLVDTSASAYAAAGAGVGDASAADADRSSIAPAAASDDREVEAPATAPAPTASAPTSTLADMVASARPSARTSPAPGRDLAGTREHSTDEVIAAATALGWSAPGGAPRPPRAEPERAPETRAPRPPIETPTAPAFLTRPMARPAAPQTTGPVAPLTRPPASPGFAFVPAQRPAETAPVEQAAAPAPADEQTQPAVPGGRRRR